VKVPDLKWHRIGDVTKILGDANLKLGAVHSKGQPDVVAEQHPPKGQDVPVGSPVDVWATTAPTKASEPQGYPRGTPLPPPEETPNPNPREDWVEVPDVRTHTQARARWILAFHHLGFGGSTKIASDDQKPGNIIDQSPKTSSRSFWRSCSQAAPFQDDSACR